MIKKCKKIVDYGSIFCALLTDLSKAFDCISHDLFIAKLEVYCFWTNALYHVYDCLPNRKQKVKINETFSSWKDKMWCSTTIYSSSTIIQYTSMWLFLLPWRSGYCKLCRYAVKENKESVTNTLETSSQPLFTWFNNTFMKTDSDKSPLLLSCSEPSKALINGSSVESNAKEILLGITIDTDLKFDGHVNNLYKKLRQNFNALARNAPFINVDKKE